MLGVGALPRSAHANPTDLGQMMWDFTIGYIRHLDEKRRRQFAAIETPEQLDALRRKVRNRLAEMWGPMPEDRTPLNPRQLGTIDRPGYVIEKIIYESRPKFYVTANLYRPKHVEERLPAVIFPPGHAGEGKAYKEYQQFCIVMARSGFAVLIWDPISQGERVQLWDAENDRPLVGLGTKEHRVLGRQCYLLGLNLMQYRVWDSIRAIDYLETRPEVDRERIAMAGNSGGGMETLQFAPFEPRIKAAAPMCAVAGFREKTEALLIADPEQILYRTLHHGIDHTELLASVAPRPLMIGAAIRDYVPIQGARATYRAVSKAYALVQANEKATLAETDDVHGLNKDLREATARWFSHWLSDGRVSEQDPSGDVLPEEELRCTASGQVATALSPAATVLSWNRRYADKTAPKRAVPASPDEFAIFRTEINRQVQFLTRVGRVKRERGIFVPDRVIDPPTFAKGDALVVSDTGKDEPSLRRSVIDPLVAAGYRVTALDLRGWGETAPRMPRFEVSFSWDEFFAYRALEVGRPLLGQRVRDLLAAAPKRTTHRKWTLVGVGAGALVAAHAAVIDTRISRLITVGGLLSYRSLIDDPLTTQPLSSDVPSVIGAYDVKELHAALAPRPVMVINPMDSRRRPVERVKAWDHLDWTAQVYEMMGAADSFRLETQINALQIRAAVEEWVRTKT